MTIMNKTYSYCENDADQYAGMDFSVSQPTRIADAQYIHRIDGAGNPLLEAIPLKKDSKTELKEIYNYVPKNFPTAVELKKLDPARRDDTCSLIKDFRIYLPYTRDVANEVNRALIEAYRNRSEMKCRNDLIFRNEEIATESIFCSSQSGVPVNGFSLLGVSGTGKTTVLDKVLGNYPQVIVHHLGGEDVIQILYLKVTTVEKSNFSALYSNIGESIDKALGNGNHAFKNMINRKKTLGEKSQKICELIEKLNIGMIILDEIQNMNLDSMAENSIQSFLRMSNDTGVAIAVVGTEEAYENMFMSSVRSGRLVRRILPLIKSGLYCKDEEMFRSIITTLFCSFPVFEGVDRPGDEIIQAFWDNTEGVMAHITDLFYYLVREYLSRKKRPELTPEYINLVTDKYLFSITKMIEKQNSFEPAAVHRRRMLKEMNAFLNPEKIGETEISEKVVTADEIPETVKKITENIMKLYPNYVEKTVIDAVSRFSKDDPDNDIFITAQAVNYLNSYRKSAPKKPKNRTEMKQGQMLDAILGQGA